MALLANPEIHAKATEPKISDSTSAENNSSVEAKPKGGPQRHEIALDGKTEAIGILPESKKAIAERLRVRLGIAMDLSEDQKRLGTFDRLLLQKGEQVIEKFAGLESMDREDLAVAWAVIHDELIQKSSATDRMVKQEQAEGKPAKFQRLSNIPFLRRFARDEEPGGPVIDTRVIHSEAPHLTSDYMDKLHFVEWSPDEIEQDLKSLNNLRVAVEKQLGFETSEDDWAIPDFQKGSRSRLNNAVVDRMDLILQREHEGKSYVELHQEDPVKATMARHKAIQEGLMHFSPEFAKSVLTAEKPEVDIARINKQLAEIDKPADPEDIALKTTENTEAQIKRDSAKKEYEGMRDSEDKAELDVVSAEDAVEDARANFKAVDGTLVKEIEALRGDLAALPPPPSGLDAEAMSAFTAGNRAERDRIYKEIDKKETERKRMLLEIATAERAKIKAERKRGVLKDGEDVKGSIKWAKKAYDDAEKDFKDKEKALKELTEPGDEKADRKRALEMWRAIMERDSGGVLNYEKIIALGFAQKGDEARFTRDQLASVLETDEDQLAGAELIREHIFGVIDDEWDINPKNQELAREILPDDEIAVAIIRTFNLDVKALGLPADADPQTVLKKLLPYLKNANQFQVGDMMRFIVAQGLRGAEKGRHILRIEDRFLDTKAENRLDAFGILRENMGNVEIGRTEKTLHPQVRWEGSVSKINGAIFGAVLPITETEFNFRVTEEFDGGQVAAGVEVNVNEEFLKYLPTTSNPNMPLEIRQNFYDATGAVRIEVREMRRKGLFGKEELKGLRIPEWVTVSDPVLNGGIGQDGKFHAATSADMLDALENIYSSELPRKLATQTANEVLSMSPKERVEVIKGVPEFIVTYPEAGTGVMHDVRIRLDNNGDFWIAEPDGSNEQELKAHFMRRENDFRGARQALSTDERQGLQREFGTIEQYIGMSILENQQYK